MARLLLGALAGEDFEEGLVDVLADVGGDEPGATATQVRCLSMHWLLGLVKASWGRLVQLQRCLNLLAW